MVIEFGFRIFGLKIMLLAMHNIVIKSKDFENDTDCKELLKLVRANFKRGLFMSYYLYETL